MSIKIRHLIKLGFISWIVLYSAAQPADSPRDITSPALKKTIQCYLDQKPALNLLADKFSLQNAHTLALLSMIIYAAPKDARNFAQQIEGVETAEWIYSNTDTQAMWLEGKTMAILVFRGTEVHSRSDIKTDLLTYFKSAEPFSRVHAGFQQSLNSVWNRIFNHVSKRQTALPLLITGHSLGAALATLAAAKILQLQTNQQSAESLEKENLWPMSYVQGLYTYGQPRVGNQDFATIFDYLVKKSRLYPLPGTNIHPATVTVRLVNGNDIVPRLPDGFFYAHVGELKYFDQSGKLHEGREAEELMPSSVFTLPIEDFDWIEDHSAKNYVEKTYTALYGVPSGC
jgi:triacylglycerol lipase